jgi:hypothetical protein
MPANYVLLSTVTTNATVATIDLLNIPQTGYTDLIVTWATRTPNGTPVADNLLIAFNGSAGNGLTEVLAGNGTTASQFTDTGTYTAMGTVGGAATANTFSNGQLYVGDYASSTKFKNMQLESVTENAGTYSGTALATFVYQLTTPISSITLVPNYANFSADSTFTIYGVAALNTTPVVVPKASGGDIIKNDGTYWYHTFLSSGAFIPNQALTADYLVVAGAGAGVGNSGGGGGAGGMRCTVTGTGGSGSLESPLSLTAQAYTVTIGAGGAGASALNNLRGANGSNSVFASITSTGGGGGGNRLAGSPIGNGAIGGSGGGAAVDGYTGGAGTSGQGFAGGDAPGATNPAGGGGGAAAVGQIGGTGNLSGGDGGAGRATVISGTSTFYAGGGGGAYNLPGSGEGGVGGGASSPTSSNTGGNAGTVNTGGGGSAGVGGAGTGPNGGSGGSGIVIVRYTMA